MHVILARRFLKRMKKFAPNLNEMHRRNLKNKLIFMAICCKDSKEAKSIDILRPILGKEVMLVKFKEFVKQFRIIQ
jgi:hypothetical protein